MTHHVIYVPGLGDAKPQGQHLVTWLWRVHGLRGHYIPMHWADGEAYAPKLQRLLDKIDELGARGDRVSLIGTSAGASSVLNAYAARRQAVTAVVCICGKIQHPETVHQRTFSENPAFETSLHQAQTSLKQLTMQDRSHILSIHPKSDNVVPVADTIINGAVERTIPTTGHSPSIAYALTVGMATIAQFIKRV